MATINEALAQLDDVLGNPKAQKPTVSQRFTQLAFEFQNLINELNNTSLPWTKKETTVSITPGTEDYSVIGNLGTVLFAYANSSNNAFGPVGLEIADFAGVSSDFYLFSPLDYGFARDFNEAFYAPTPAQIALYRDGGQLMFRVPPFAGTELESITLVTATGNWLSGLTSEDEAVLPGHHMLAIVRAAGNLLPDSEWSGSEEHNGNKMKAKAESYSVQEKRYAAAWHIAKRTFNAGQPTYRTPYGGAW